MRVLHGPHHRRRRWIRLLSPSVTALIVIAHGSRSALANDEVRALARWLEGQKVAERVEAAFLEQAEPTLEGAADLLIANGAREIRVFPLFLNSGRHVARDVPGLVASAAARHPGVVFHTLPHLGAADGFNAAVLTAIQSETVTATRPDAA